MAFASSACVNMSSASMAASSSARAALSGARRSPVGAISVVTVVPHARVAFSIASFIIFSCSFLVDRFSRSFAVRILRSASARAASCYIPNSSLALPAPGRAIPLRLLRGRCPFAGQHGRETGFGEHFPQPGAHLVARFRRLVEDADHLGEAVVYSIVRSEEHTSELQSRQYLVCRLLLEKKKNTAHLYKL